MQCEFCEREATTIYNLRETGEIVHVCDFCEEDLKVQEIKEQLEDIQYEIKAKKLIIAYPAFEALLKLKI